MGTELGKSWPVGLSVLVHAQVRAVGRAGEDMSWSGIGRRCGYASELDLLPLGRRWSQAQVVAGSRPAWPADEGRP
jgi:hypothetical protein